MATTWAATCFWDCVATFWCWFFNACFYLWQPLSIARLAFEPPLALKMSAEGANRSPKPMASREWSCDTLGRGMSQVFKDVKSEPWQDISDEALQTRLQALSFQTFLFSLSHSTNSKSFNSINRSNSLFNDRNFRLRKLIQLQMEIMRRSLYCDLFFFLLWMSHIFCDFSSSS